MVEHFRASFCGWLNCRLYGFHFLNTASGIHFSRNISSGIRKFFDRITALAGGWNNVDFHLSNCWVSLLRGIVLIALAFQYYNLVERRDAKGIMDKLNQFGQAVDTTPRANETY